MYNHKSQHIRRTVPGLARSTIWICSGYYRCQRTKNETIPW